MNQLIDTGNGQPTMSSQEIAELVESRHDKVKQSIERLSARGVIQLPPLGELRNHRGQSVTEYRLGKRESYIIVAQLCPEFTARLVDRWQELERQAANEAFEVPGSYSEALRLAADKAEQVEQLESENDRLNAVCNDLAENLKEGLTPAQFCRQLNGVNTQKVQQLLVAWGRLIATRHGYRAPSQFRDRLFSERHIQKAGATYEKVVLTQKGAKWLYALYEKGQLPMKQDWDGVYTHMLFEPGQARITGAMEARA